MLKVSLVKNLFIVLFLIYCESESHEFIKSVIKDSKIKNITSNPLEWSDYGFESLSDFSSILEFQDKFGGLFQGNQRLPFEEQYEKKFSLEKRCLPKHIQILKKKSQQMYKERVNSISKPLIIEADENMKFGLMLLTDVFGGEGTTELLIYEKKIGGWQKIDSILIRFS